MLLDLLLFIKLSCIFSKCLLDYIVFEKVSNCLILVFEKVSKCLILVFLIRKMACCGFLCAYIYQSCSHWSNWVLMVSHKNNT